MPMSSPQMTRMFGFAVEPPATRRVLDGVGAMNESLLSGRAQRPAYANERLHMARTAVAGTRVGHHAGPATRRRTPARRIGALECRGHWTKGASRDHTRSARARRAKGQYVSAVSRR